MKIKMKDPYEIASLVSRIEKSSGNEEVSFAWAQLAVRPPKLPIPHSAPPEAFEIAMDSARSIGDPVWIDSVRRIAADQLERLKTSTRQANVSYMTAYEDERFFRSLVKRWA